MVYHDNSRLQFPTVRCAALAFGALLGIVALCQSQTRWSTLRPNDHGKISFHHARRRLTSLIDEEQDLPAIFPFRQQDYIGFGCAILGLLLASGGGIGGGGMLVPIYILLLEFPVKHAIPLASVTVLGGAMANNLLNVRKVHPDHPERPVIDWDLILQLQPMTIAGALIGADLNEKLPEVVLLVLMLLLLTVTAVTTLRKACKLYRKEEEEKKNGSVLDADDERGNNGQNSAPVKLDLTNDTNGNGNWIIGDIFDAGSPTVKDMSFVNWTYFEMDSGATKQKYGECDNIDESNREAIKRQCTKDAIKLITLFTVVTTLDLLEGTPDGTVFYKIREVLIFGSIVLFSLYVRLSLLKRQEAGGAILSDIRWDERNTIIYPSISIVAGLTAGMFGIGGGIIKGPLMLALGVHPQVASATSACMILFTSSTSTISYHIFGDLKYDYAMFCLLMGFTSTLVGQTAMSALLEWSGQRSSYIAFCIGSVVAVSAAAMGIESVVAIFYS